MPRKPKETETPVPETAMKSASEIWESIPDPADTDAAADESQATDNETAVIPENDENETAAAPDSDEAEQPASDPIPKRPGRKAKAETKAPESVSDEPATPVKKSFYGINFRQLDKDLSPDEQKEWNAIYASYRAGSILSGKVAGVDTVKLGKEAIDCLVVFDYRVKVLIPAGEVWEDAERPGHVLHSLLGAEIDYVIKEVDREGYWAVASRKQALYHRRKSFRKRLPKAGDLVDCRVLAVSQNKLMLECGGHEVTLSQNGISYGKILDLRETYRPGQSVKAVFKGLDGDGIQLSIKEVNPHPFEGIEQRHPLHHRRLSRIVGKHAGGVFCELEKGFSCLCLYSPEQMDCDFDLGDNVIVVITKYDFTNKLVYGRIVTSW